MSESRAKRSRQAQRRRPEYILNAERINRLAKVVLALDMSDLVLRNRVPQFAIGLCRAAFAQSEVVAMLAIAGLAGSSAPNRRLFLEAALRLQWIAELSTDARRQAVDSMLAKDRKDTNTTLDYLSKLGQGVDFDATEMNSFDLDAPDIGSIQEQARKLDAAVKSTEGSAWSIYAMWREETKHAHPSGALAGQYAPTFDDAHISFGEPDPMDPSLEAHLLIQSLIVTNTGRILAQEGASDDVAGRIPTAFFIVS